MIRKTFIPLMLGLLCLCGCNSNRIPGLVPAEGVVIFEGSPLPNAIVSFSPKGDQGMAGTAITNENGQFVITTRNRNDGLLPGEYAVMVLKTAVLFMPTEEENEAHMERTGQYMEPIIEQIVPDLFGSDQTTPLTYTMSSKGDRKIVIDFTAKTTSADTP